MKDMKRRVLRGAAVIAVAAAAGHFVQGANQPDDRAAAEPQRPTGITQVAAGPEAAGQPAPHTQSQSSAPAQTPAPEIAAATAVDPAVLVDAAPTSTDLAAPAAEPAAEAEAVARSCDIALDLSAESGAMIGLVLTAPCHPGQRVVLTHAGLAVTGKTTESGSLFARLPALEAEAMVRAKFADGNAIESIIAVPEVTGLTRFGIQWQGVDGFGIHALPNGTAMGQPGDISAANTRMPLPGVTPTDGYLSILGDSTVDLPLLAEVFTWPTKPGQSIDVLVEAAVTTTTCGGDLLGETLNSIGGTTYITDLTLAMPECDAIGDYLVLKNLVLDPKLALAD